MQALPFYMQNINHSQHARKAPPCTLSASHLLYIHSTHASHAQFPLDTDAIRQLQTSTHLPQTCCTLPLACTAKQASFPQPNKHIAYCSDRSCSTKPATCYHSIAGSPERMAESHISRIVCVQTRSDQSDMPEKAILR